MTTAGDDYDEITYWKQFIEEEEKAEQSKEPSADDLNSEKQLKRFCNLEILKRLEAIEEALTSRVPDSICGCSSKDFLEPAKKLGL